MKDSREHISKTMGWWGSGALEGDCYPEKTAKVQALIVSATREAQDELWRRAWAIIANAGGVWDLDSEVAKGWREAAWAFERREADSRSKS